MKQKKVKINTKAVASHYESPNERIIEYSLPTGLSSGPIGGLICFYAMPDGTIRINLYRHDPQVEIIVSEADNHIKPKVKRLKPGTAVQISFNKGKASK